MSPQERNVASFTLAAASLLPWLIITFALFNGFFNSMATAIGYGFPRNTFCFTAADRFADFFKTALSFPGPNIKSLDAWPELYRDYFVHNYGGITALAEGKLSNLHGMPLPTVIALMVRRALAFYNPNRVMFGFFAATIIPFSVLIWAQCRKSSSCLVTVIAFLMSYPLLLAVTRGHLNSVMLGEVLITALLLIRRGSMWWLVSFLLALAINLRPNAVLLLALPLLRLPLRQCIALAAAALIMATAIFFGSLVVANIFYPDYTLGNFYQALLVYRRIYALGDYGFAYGSSLFGGLKFLDLLLGTQVPKQAIELLTSLLGLAGIALWLILALRRRLEPIHGAFTLMAIYALFTSVFGDYHLIVFFGIVLLYAHQNCNPFAAKDWPTLAIGAATLFVLVPKNYVFSHGLSAQVFLNPLILMIATLAVFAAALKREKIVTAL